MRARTAVPRLWPVAAGLVRIDPSEANELLTMWGHYLGPVNRPFGSEAWAFEVADRRLAVAVSASIVSARIRAPRVAVTGGEVIVEPETFTRGEVVELARLCADPGERWATRVMLRLWREVAAPAWSYWPVRAAVAYSQNARHDGRLYRFDGWEKLTDRAGSSGGGAWSRKRYATDAVHGPKTLWLWRYEGGDPA